MSVRTLRSPAKSRNPDVVELARERRENNLQWLERALAMSPIGKLDGRSLVLLVGGDDPLSFRLRVAQSHARHDLSPSAWSLALYLPALAAPFSKCDTIGVDLAPPNGFANFGYTPPVNAIQSGHLATFASANLFPNIALLVVPVAAADVERSIEDLRQQRSILDLSMLVLKWLEYVWGVGAPTSPLADGFGMPSAAMLEAAFAANGFDLTPGLESRSSCPEAIWQAATWWYEYYDKRHDGARIAGAYIAKHDLVPDIRYGGSPPDAHPGANGTSTVPTGTTKRATNGG
jgi:hypothetical protein